MTAGAIDTAPAFRRGPAPKRWQVERGRRYAIEGLDPTGPALLWSVTTITGNYPKPWLGRWAAKRVAETVLERWSTVAAMKRDGDDVALVEYLKGSPYRERDRSGDLGSRVHDAAEALVLGRPRQWAPDEAPYLRSLERFLLEHRPNYLAAEATVANLVHAYAGTLDAVVELEGRPTVIDYKTSESGPYVEDALQLAAYRHATLIYRLPDGTSEPMLETAGAAVVKLRPDGYGVFPVRSDELVFSYFLHLARVFRFVVEYGDERSPEYVIGDYTPSDEVLGRQLAGSIEASS